jgi:hypothetical protein
VHSIFRKAITPTKRTAKMGILASAKLKEEKAKVRAKAMAKRKRKAKLPGKILTTDAMAAVTDNTADCQDSLLLLGWRSDFAEFKTPKGNDAVVLFIGEALILEIRPKKGNGEKRRFTINVRGIRIVRLNY